MRCYRLTSHSEKLTDENGRARLVSHYDWRGERVAICDSALNVLSLIELFSDDSKSPQEKQTKLIHDLFFDPPAAIAVAGDDLATLIEDAMWDICGLDVTHDHRHTEEHESPIFDWNEDAPRIRASLLQAYGINWNNQADEITFSNICELLNTLVESSDTPFQKAIMYRAGSAPKRTKYNGDIVDAWNECRDHYALKGEGYDPIEQQNDAMADMFAAAEKAAM